MLDAAVKDSSEDNIENNHKKGKANLKHEIKSILYILLLALFIRTALFEPYHIPSPSMRENLIEGDYVISTKYNYGYSMSSIPFYIPLKFFDGRLLFAQPTRGDIIIFWGDMYGKKERYIKRLVGLPGDKVRVRQGVVYVNGEATKRKYIESFERNNEMIDAYEETNHDNITYKVFYRSKQMKYHLLFDQNNTKEFIVPEGSYFFMGDNRDYSNDSRIDLGTIQAENIIGKASFILYSFAEPLFLSNTGVVEQVMQVWYWVTSFRLDRFFKKLY